MNSTGNLVTPEKFLGSGIKCDTSDPDSPKAGNELFNYFTMTLNTLCKHLLILISDSSSFFNSLYAFLIWSRILNMVFCVLMSRCMQCPSPMSSISFVLIDLSSESLSVDDLSIESRIDSSSTTLRLFFAKFPS